MTDKSDIFLRDLSANDPETRKGAASMLGDFIDVRAVEPLIGLLQDERFDVRIAAASSLAVYKDGRAIEPLISALNDPDIYVRVAVIRTLGALGDARALDPLMTIFRNIEGLRATVIQAFGNISDPSIFNTIMSLVDDHDEDVRHAAAVALGGYKNSLTLPALTELSRDEDTEVAEAATCSLGELGTREAVEPLTDLLSDEELWYTHLAAVGALGDIGLPECIAPLVQAANNSNGLVQEVAVRMLGRFKDHRAVVALETISSGEDQVLAQVAKATLEQINHPHG